MALSKLQKISKLLFRPCYVIFIFTSTMFFCLLSWLVQKNTFQPIPITHPLPPSVSTDVILIGDVLHEQLRRRPRQEISQKNTEPFYIDFAADYLGALVLNASATYNDRTFVSFAGIPVFYETPKPPSIMLRRSVHPLNKSDHWKMKGRFGNFSIVLYGPTIIHSFGYRHANVTDVYSVPLHFVFACRLGPDEALQQIGRFTYNATNGGLQKFYLEKPTTAQFVNVRVLSNNGCPDYTAMYRFFVFGELDSQSYMKLF